MKRRCTIGMIHYKIMGTDGVSLEMNKWKKVLEDAGHTVHLLGAEVGDDAKLIHPALHHTSIIAKRLYHYSFVEPVGFNDEEEYREVLYEEAGKAEEVLTRFIEEHKIDLLIPQNIWSVAMNPAVAIAMERVAKRFSLPVVAQHHDFYWERLGGAKISSPTAKELVQRYLPPLNPDYRHVVINTMGQSQMLNRRSLESTIIPNVFDFERPTWVIDEYNRDLRSAIGLAPEDIMILQATRIVERKGIELAIDLIARINAKRDQLVGTTLWDGRTFKEDSVIVLVLAGYASDDATGTYQKRLLEHAKEKKVPLKFISDSIGHERAIIEDKKIYSLWDSYVHADLITYPSYWEGWGNQFLEGLFAKRPMVVYEYPIFISDIKERGFDYISLGSTHKKDDKNGLIRISAELLEVAADLAISYLTDEKMRETAVEKNFKIGKEFYSMEALKGYLLPLIEER